MNEAAQTCLTFLSLFYGCCRVLKKKGKPPLMTEDKGIVLWLRCPFFCCYTQVSSRTNTRSTVLPVLREAVFFTRTSIYFLDVTT
jgi:hypothetical protein